MSSYMTIFSIYIKAILVVSLRIGVVGVLQDLQGDIGWYKEHVYTIFTLLIFFVSIERFRVAFTANSKRKFGPRFFSCFFSGNEVRRARTKRTRLGSVKNKMRGISLR